MKKLQKILMLLIALLTITSMNAVTYYSTGNFTANTPTNWKTNRDGTGTSPANFTSGDVFVVQGTGGGAGAPHSMTTSSTISISGTGSKLWIESGATLTASNAITLASASILQIDNGGTYNHGHTGAISAILAGTEVIGASSNFNVTATSSITAGTVVSSPGLGNFTYSGGASMQCNGSFPNLQGNLTVSTAALRFNASGTSGLSATINGDLIINGAGQLEWGNGSAVNYTLYIKGNINISSSSANPILFAGTGGTSGNNVNAYLILNGTGIQTFTSNSTNVMRADASSFRNFNFTVNSGSILNMGTSTLNTPTSVNLLFTLSSGASLRTANANGISSGLTASGSIQNLGGSRTFSTGATYIYTGSANQVTGTGLPSSVAGLGINTSSDAGVNLTNPTTITGTLTLSSGKLTSTPTNLLTLGSAAVVSGGSSSSFVAGPVANTVATTNSSVKTFPMGNGSNYSPVVLTVTQDAATSTTYTAESKSGTATFNKPSSIDAVSTSRYYTITKGSGASVTAGQVQLVYDANDATGISVANKDIIRIVKDDGAGNWVDLGPDEGGTANNSGTVTSTVNFTSFSDFAIANAVQGTIPEIKTVTGTAAICPGSSTNITLGSSQTGVTYDIYKNGIPQDDTKTGDGNDLVWSVSATGTYTVKTTSDGGYAVTLMNGSAVITAKSAPSITGSSLAGNTYPQNGSASALSVTATGDGLNYQWYKSTDNSNTTSEDDEALGTNSSTFTPSTAVMGTSYYYCIVSGDCSPSATSSVSGAIIIVEACTNPTFSVHPTDNLNVCINDSPISLGTVEADQSPTYQWYAVGSKTNTGGSLIEGATNASYSPPTNVAGTFYYYVVAINGVCSTPSNAVEFIVYPATSIQSQSTGSATYSKDASATALTVTAVGKNHSYQWFSSTDAANNTAGNDVAVGTNSNSYTPSTASIGTLYYYCVVSGGCEPTSVKSSVSGAIEVVPYASGDFIAVADGNWNVVGNWNTWNGTTLVAAAAFPNANNVNVFIPNGKSINVETSARSVKDLTVEGTLTSSASNGALSYLYIYGNLTVNAGGFIGNAANPTGDYVDANDKGYDGISFRFYGANSTIKGDGGSIYVGRMLTATASMTLTINRDMTAVYRGTNNQGGHTMAVYHNGVDNTTITINQGKTLTMAPWACIGTTSSSNGLPAQNFTINVNGTLDLQDTPFPNSQTPSTARSFIYGGTGTAKVFTLNIGSSGVVSTPQFYPNGTVSGGGIPTGTTSVINIASGGLLNVSQVLDLRQANQTITGEGTVNVQSGATLRIGNASGINAQLLTSEKSLSSTANYQFEGTVSQVTGTQMPSNINNLIVNNAEGVSLSGTSTVNGSLTLTSGNLVSGVNTLTINGSTSGSGNINNASGTIIYAGTTVQTASNILNGSFNNLVIDNASGVNLASNSSVTNLTINSGKVLNINAGKQLSISSSITNNGTLNLESDETGTATLTGDVSVSANVEQHLTSGRNWYFASPISNATSNVIKGTEGNQLWERNVAGNAWTEITGTTADLTPGRGYIAKVAGTGVVSFTGALNNGQVQYPISSHAVTSGKFHLVGNPYPSYLDWQSVVTSNPDVMSTMWFRTKTAISEGNPTSIYTFSTVQYDGEAIDVVSGNANTSISRYIPPMQAFWVRIKDAVESTNFTVNNTMRNHADVSGNRFKSPAITSTQRLRLEVSNGTYTDETLLKFSQNASDGFDNFDSPKMFNNNAAIPEIYTRAGNERLVINGMNGYDFNTMIPLGFVAGQAGSFSIRSSELQNFDSDTQVYLLDKTSNSQFNLTSGESYSFTSDATSTEDRFAVLFKSASGTSSVGDNAVSGMYLSAQNGRLTLQLNTAIDNAQATVFTAAGQSIHSQAVSAPTTVLNKSLDAGVYVVKIVNGGRTTVLRTIMH